MNDLQRMAAETAMADMIQRGRVNICAIRKILEMTGGIPSKSDMQVLELMHCIDFKDYPAELLRGLPLILQRVLGAEKMTFEFQESTKRLMLIK